MDPLWVLTLFDDDGDLSGAEVFATESAMQAHLESARGTYGGAFYFQRFLDRPMPSRTIH